MMQKFLSKLLLALLWIVLTFFFLGACFAGGVEAAIFCTGVILYLCRIMWKRHVRKEAELSGGFDAYVAGIPALTEKELVKICVMEQLQMVPQQEPVAKKTVLLRMVYTGVYSLVNFLVLNKLYATGKAIWVMSLITLLYWWLMLSASTVSVLYREAKKNPTTDFTMLVRENTCAGTSVKKCIAVGAGAFLVLLIGFFALHSEEKWEFDRCEDGYTVVSYQPAALGEGEVEIPEEHKGKPVVAIGAQVFADMAMIQELWLPDTLRSIGSSAFKNCSNLEAIHLPDALEELQGEAFMNCSSLEEIRIPEKVTAIRGNTFDGCSKLEEVELHDGITAIHAFAFRGCSALEEIELPPLITEIREQTFAECESLESIRIPDGVTRIGARAFFGCSELEEVLVPDSVQEIRSSAFRECKSLKEIQLPWSTIVDERAFKDSPTEIERRGLSFRKIGARYE